MNSRESVIVENQCVFNVIMSAGIREGDTVYCGFGLGPELASRCWRAACGASTARGESMGGMTK